MDTDKLKKPVCKDYTMISIIWHFGKGRTVQTIKRSVVAGAWGDGGRDKYMELGDFYYVKLLSMVLYG